jgi:transcriptional regulator with XRE-family HTH domain
MRRKTEPTKIIDKHVGRQLRILRSARGLTQEGLARMLGVSYQQLHKYEVGTNSISASRLYEMTRILGVSPDNFFEGLDPTVSSNPAPIHSDDLLTRRQMGLLKDFSGIPEDKRDAIVGFIRSMSNG